MVLLSLLRTTANRVPMIKFRKGSLSSIPNQNQGIVIANPPVASPPETVRGASTTIEDWQLPARYKRRLIDDKECELINRGGAE